MATKNVKMNVPIKERNIYVEFLQCKPIYVCKYNILFFLFQRFIFNKYFFFLHKKFMSWKVIFLIFSKR